MVSLKTERRNKERAGRRKKTEERMRKAVGKCGVCLLANNVNSCVTAGEEIHPVLRFNKPLGGNKTQAIDIL